MNEIVTTASKSEWVYGDGTPAKLERQTTATTVALCMIVKNEAEVIVRCLDSVKPLIDYVFVEDTGSTDGTQQIIKDWLVANDIPGRVIEEPWRNFAYNRSHVLAELHKLDAIDYALMIDADEIVTCADDRVAATFKQKLTADLYHVDMRLGTTEYALPRLTRNRLPFFYRGPVHEWPDCKTEFSRAHLDGVTIIEMGGGAREKDPDTYRRDAALFEEELKRTDLDALERPRYQFYLAQSLRDSSEPERALHEYWKRIDLGGWHEEVYISLLNAARLQERLKRPVTDIVNTYKRAITVNPKRLEAVHGATKALRLADLFHEGYALSAPAIRATSYTGLFVEKWIYEYGLLDEFSVCAYYAGQHITAWLAMQALMCKNLDDVTRQRVTTNVRFAQLAKP